MTKDNRKVCLFVGSMEEGGAQRVISILSRKLVECGYDLTIFIYYDRQIQYNLDPKIKVIVLEGKTSSSGVFRNALYYRRFLRNYEGVVVSFLAIWNIFSMLCSAGLKKKIIVADRNDPRKIPRNRLLRLLRNTIYTHASAVVVQTENNKKYFTDDIKKKCSVIFNPTSLKESGIALRTEKKDVICAVGRLVGQKNYEAMLRAFAIVVGQHLEFNLWIYGEGKERDKLFDVAKTLGIDDKVVFKGHHDDVVNEICQCKIYVLSSDYEGMPNSLLEAMCSGLPVISTKVSGAVDVIEDGKNGILVDVGDVEGMASKMTFLIENEDYAKSMALEATKLFNRLDPEEVTEQWIKIIGSV